MEAFKCDRCGAYYDRADIPFTDGINPRKVYEVYGATERKLDLCPNCIKELTTFMNPKIPAWDRTCRECKHQNGLPTADPCYSCSMRFPTFDNWEAMDDGED